MGQSPGRSRRPSKKGRVLEKIERGKGKKDSLKREEERKETLGAWEGKKTPEHDNQCLGKPGGNEASCTKAGERRKLPKVAKKRACECSLQRKRSWSKRDGKNAKKKKKSQGYEKVTSDTRRENCQTHQKKPRRS